MTLWARGRSWLSALLGRRRMERDMDAELRFHIEMETQRIMRVTGVDVGEARRQAALAFGGIEKYRGAARDVLGFTESAACLWTCGSASACSAAVRA